MGRINVAHRAYETNKKFNCAVNYLRFHTGYETTIKKTKPTVFLFIGDSGHSVLSSGELTDQVLQ